MSETIAPAFAGLHSPQLLPFDPRELRIFWSGQRTLALATALTLLVMDMYEHLYHMVMVLRRRRTSTHSSSTCNGTKSSAAWHRRRHCSARLSEQPLDARND